MNEAHSNINQAVHAADCHLEQQAAANQRIIEEQAAKRQAKNGLTSFIILGICVAVIAYRLPRIAEPFQWPDVNSPAVVEADIGVIVAAVESYKLLNGKYPVAIADIWLPADLSELLQKTPIVYDRREDGFALDWTLPKIDVKYDSHLHHLEVNLIHKR